MRVTSTYPVTKEDRHGREYEVEAEVSADVTFDVVGDQYVVGHIDCAEWLSGHLVTEVEVHLIEQFERLEKLSKEAA